MEITSKSLLNPKTEFSLKFFKKPFCYNEKKKFKLYEMPKFKSKFFKSGSRKFNKMGKILFISGPARSGNHLALSLLDSHPEIRRDIGEDDMLRTMFTYAKKNELKVVNNMKKKNLQYLLSMSGEPRWGLKSGFNKWSELNLLREKNLKSKVWSGHQLEGHYHVTDFQNYIPKIYYSLFVNYFIRFCKRVCYCFTTNCGWAINSIING